MDKRTIEDIAEELFLNEETIRKVRWLNEILDTKLQACELEDEMIQIIIRSIPNKKDREKLSRYIKEHI